MTAAAEVLHERIERSGPMPFHEFMKVSLYDPRVGYYRRGQDPFGKSGDFYTAEQLQPVFGILVSTLVKQLSEDAGDPAAWSVVELGPGRREMAGFFNDWRYVPIDVEDEPPDRASGIVFANEFFDALPVDLFVRRDGGFLQMLVGGEATGFQWVEGEAAANEAADYLRHYADAVPEGGLVEVNLPALDWIDRVGNFLVEGYLLILDYGYTARELVRFPSGTLMSYRKHRAIEDVLKDPGEQDITAHVCFTAIEDHAHRRGFETLRYETLGRMLLRIGEPDEFRCVTEGVEEDEKSRRMLQLKTLLFGMGDTFSALLLRKPGVRAK